MEHPEVLFDEEDNYDEDGYEFDGSEDDDDEVEYHYHNHVYDDLYDDVGDDFDVWDLPGFNVEDHEMSLFEYHPELLDEEEVDLFKVLKLAEMTSKLVDAVKLRISRVGSEDLQWVRSSDSLPGVNFPEILEIQLELLSDGMVSTAALPALLVEGLLGGAKNLEDLDRESKVVKKFAMRSLRGHLAEVMPTSLDDHILDNILEHINSQEEGKFVASSSEEKSVVTEIYECLSAIYDMITSYLFSFVTPPFAFVISDNHIACSQWIEDLHAVVGRISEEATTEEPEEILEDSLWITNQLDQIDLKD